MREKTRKLILLCLLLLLSVISCVKAKDIMDFKNPSVSSSYPSNNQNGVPNEAEISIEFSEDMNKASVHSALSFSSGGSSVEYSLSWENNHKIILTPTSKMTTGSQYQVIISDSAIDSNNNKLKSTFILMFTVNPDTTKPENTAIEVQGYTDPINTPPFTNIKRPEILIHFSEPMDIEKTTAAVSHEDIKAVYHWENSNQTLRLELLSDLEYGKKYLIVVGQAASDVAGNLLKEDKSKFFYAGNSFTIPYVTNFYVQKVGEATPLTDLLSISNQSQIVNNISDLTKIHVYFNNPMDIVSLKQAISISPSVSIKNTTLISPNVLEITIQENESWTYGKQYSVKIASTAKDTSGNSLTDDFEISFVIGSDLTTPKITAITVLDKNSNSQDIKNAGSVVNNIPLNPKLTITFDKAMDTTSVRDAISISPSISGSYLIITASIDKKTFTVEIQKELSYGQTYELSISTSAKDESKNLNLDQSYKAAFTVGDKSNFLKITSITYNGASANTNVSLTPSIIVTFDKNIDLTSCYGNIQIFPTYSLTNSEISLNSSNSILITPKDALKDGTQYQITFSQEIHVLPSSDSLKPPMAEDNTFYFTTTTTNKFEIKDIIIKNSSTSINAMINKVKVDPVENVDTDSISSNEAVDIEITFTQNFKSSTIIDNISVTKGYAPNSGSKIPYISNYQNLTAGNTNQTVKITVQNVLKGENYYILEIKGESSGVNSAEGVPLDSSITIIFKTKSI